VLIGLIGSSVGGAPSICCLVSLASSDGARSRACFGLSGDIGSAPLANGLNILHIVLAQDISICYVLAVGLYMITFDGGFADDPVGGSRQAGAIVGLDRFEDICVLET
jgi:hypothetical protein